jgi:hypothetical protein
MNRRGGRFARGPLKRAAVISRAWISALDQRDLGGDFGVMIAVRRRRLVERGASDAGGNVAAVALPQTSACRCARPGSVQELTDLA